MHPVYMGELRSLLATPHPTAATWAAICALLIQQWQPRREEEEIIAAYCAPALARWPAEVVREAPMSWIKRLISTDHVPAMLRHVTRLHLRDLRRILSPEQTARIGQAAETMTSLRELDLWDCSLSTEGVRAWADADFPALESLWLEPQAFSFGAIEAWAASSWAPRIRRLTYRGSRPHTSFYTGHNTRAEHIRALDTALRLPRLRALTLEALRPDEDADALLIALLGGNQIASLTLRDATLPGTLSAWLDNDWRGLRHLHIERVWESLPVRRLYAPWLAHVESVTLLSSLPQRQSATAALCALMARSDMPALTALHLQSLHPRIEGQPLTGAPWLGQLHTLAINYPPEDHMYEEPITDSLPEHMPHLRRLELSCCELDPQGLRELLERKRWFAQLEHLDLSRNPLGPEGLELLADHPATATALRTLRLDYVNPGVAGHLAIARNPHLGALEAFSMEDYLRTRAALEAIATSTTLPAPITTLYQRWLS